MKPKYFKMHGTGTLQIIAKVKILKVLTFKQKQMLEIKLSLNYGKDKQKQKERLRLKMIKQD